LKAPRELKLTVSEGRLFQMFTTRSVKNVDLTRVLLRCLNN